MFEAIKNFTVRLSVKKGNSSNVDNTGNTIIKSKGNTYATNVGNTTTINNIDYQKNYEFEVLKLQPLCEKFNPITALEAEYNALFTKLNDVDREYNNLLPQHLLKQNENFPQVWQSAIMLLVEWRKRHNKDTTVLEGMKTRYQ